MLGVVPLHEGQYPLPGLVYAAEAVGREPRAELQGLEQRFRVSVVIGKRSFHDVLPPR